MLSELTIQNYAIIDHIHIELHEGLNIITGETGAGKSIIMGALGLVLGNRVDSSVIKNNSGKCIIEALFKIKNEDILRFVTDNDLDTEDDTILIRREVTATGKSRSFVNDTPVNLSDLKTITSFLIDQHQQFDNLLLGKNTFQQKIVDSLAKNATLLTQYQGYFHRWQKAKSELEILIQRKNAFNRELDFMQFQYNELEEINLKENELEELENEIKLLENAGEIKSILNKISFNLYEDENSVINILKSLNQELKNYLITQEIESIAERLKSAEIELKDLALESASAGDAHNFDAEKLEIINDRLTAGYKLLKKHNVLTTNELLSIKNTLELKLQDVLNIDSEIEKVKEQVAALEAQCMDLANEISGRRKEQVNRIEETVNALLVRVGMPNARLHLQVVSNNELKINGLDDILFLFDANKTGNFESVDKVASGGELSRLMLCIKSMVAKDIDMPTLIFDEIDTGISGEAARQVGIIMQELAGNLQVISITHQPQIAALADAHYFVYKKENEKQEINTRIRLLETQERITQIAQMISGANPSAAAINNAKELLAKSK